MQKDAFPKTASVARWLVGFLSLLLLAALFFSLVGGVPLGTVFRALAVMGLWVMSVGLFVGAAIASRQDRSLGTALLAASFALGLVVWFLSRGFG